MSAVSATALSKRNAIALGCFALAVGVILVIANALTSGAIENNEQRRFNAALTEVLPADYFDNDIKRSPLTLEDTARLKSRTVYRGWNNNAPAAVVIRTHTADGYSGRIDMLIGLTYDSEVTGVRVLNHKETPGLGDDIEFRKSDWILSFNGKQLDAGLRWEVKRDGGDFDQFTGATITPRAFVREVRQTIEWFAQHRQQIYSTQ